MMYKPGLYLVFTTVVLSSPSVAMAHPGHGYGGGSFGVLHYLIEPVHLYLGAAVIGVIVAGVYWLRRNTS